MGGDRPGQPCPEHHQHVGQYRPHLETAVSTAENFAETVKIYEQAKRYYDALRSVNNLVRDARKVQETILMVGEVSDIYITNFRK